MNWSTTTISLVAGFLISSAIVLSRPPQSPDFDEDGTVGFSDFVQFAGVFGSTSGDGKYQAKYDLDRDGTIGFRDFVIFARDFGEVVDRTTRRDVNYPLRAVHVSGNWGTHEQVIEAWEASGKVGSLIPRDYIDWLTRLHVNWVGISAGLHFEDSMDSTVGPDDSAFSDEILKQLIDEFRNQGFEVYLTLALNDHEAGQAARPAKRWQLGGPVTPTGPDAVLPEFWPWRPDHPDHERFVAEFWETYTLQAVHYAEFAEENGVRLYSLGTETDALFRTRSGDSSDPSRYWTNHFGQELRSIVDRVRAVYGGLLTYDMHYSALTASDHFGPGSNHLWEDLDLEVVGISAWFPLADTTSKTPMSIDAAQMQYEEIFSNYLKPLADRNPNRPILFLEYGTTDLVSAPEAPDVSDFSEYVFFDVNGNALDDGRETQANIYAGLLNAMANNPGLLNGVFFWDNWIASDGLWAKWWSGRRSFSIRDKLSEEVVRSAYASFAHADPSPDIMAFCDEEDLLKTPGFVYTNNMWGRGNITDFEQCLLKCVDGGETTYGWQWRWPLVSGNVKAYPEVIFGHKPLGHPPIPPTAPGLPKRISDINRFQVSYDVETTARGLYNLAFEMWVTSDNPPTTENITHEIMVWVDHTISPALPEFIVGEVEIDGAVYDLYIDPGTGLEGDDKYIAFSSRKRQLSGTLNFEKFIGHLVAHHLLPTDQFVTSVELGNEVIEGTGETWIRRFRVIVD